MGKSCEHQVRTLAVMIDETDQKRNHIQSRHLVTSRSYPRDLNMESDRDQLQPNLDQQLHREQSNSYDGVDTSQWQSICRLVINERCYDVSIWFAIWHILFPGVRAPENPCRLQRKLGEGAC